MSKFFSLGGMLSSISPVILFQLQNRVATKYLAEAYVCSRGFFFLLENINVRCLFFLATCRMSSSNGGILSIPTSILIHLLHCVGAQVFTSVFEFLCFNNPPSSARVSLLRRNQWSLWASVWCWTLPPGALPKEPVLYQKVSCSLDPLPCHETV